MSFIHFLLEEREIYATKYTAEEAAQIPQLSSGNLEGVARVGNVIFDQKNGLGATPNNQNVVYRGFVGMMKPSDFLLFAAKADRGEDAKEVLNLIKDGYGIGSPFLYLKLDNDEETSKIKMSIVGHEGRARSVALNTLQPNVNIPVHFFMYGETRARHIKDQVVKMLNSSITAERTGEFVKNRIDSIWLNGTHIKL